jgi:hypothetical protein
MTSPFRLINVNKFRDYNIRLHVALYLMMVLNILEDRMSNILCCIGNLDCTNIRSSDQFSFYHSHPFV